MKGKILFFAGLMLFAFCLASGLVADSPVPSDGDRPERGRWNQNQGETAKTEHPGHKKPSDNPTSSGPASFDKGYFSSN